MDLDQMERDADALENDCDCGSLGRYGASHIRCLVAEVRRLRAERPSSLSELREKLSAEWQRELDRIEADGFVDPPAGAK